MEFRVEPETGSNEYVNDKVTPVEKVRVTGIVGQLTEQQMNTIITSCFEQGLNMSLFTDVQLKQTANPFTWSGELRTFLTPVKSSHCDRGFTVSV